MNYLKITYEVTDDVAVVRLNDPATLNAVTAEMGKELRDALRRAQTEARAMLLCSAGRAFCSGAFLGEGLFDLNDPQRDVGVGLESEFNPWMAEVHASTIPIVGAVRGAAAGAGCSIALAPDLIVASEDAYFVQSFQAVGLVPDAGSTYYLMRTLGRARAMEMMLLGDRIPAATALEWGLINRVVPGEELEARALELARRLARGPRGLGLVRKAAWLALDTPFAQQLETERTLQRDAGRTEDFCEGVRAFRERRQPTFKGR